MEDYVNFEVAKLLKEKGFDEKTLTYYEDGFICHGIWFEWNRSPLGHIAAPTFQMSMKWLREVQHIECHIVMDELKVDNTRTYMYDIYSNSSDRNFNSVQEHGFASYEEACEAAIKYCLENLI